MWIRRLRSGMRARRVSESARRPAPERASPSSQPSGAVQAFAWALVLALAVGIAPAGAADRPAGPQAGASPLRVVPIVLTGEPSPGLAGGVVAPRLEASLINAGGDVACAGWVDLPGGRNEKARCLWVGRPGDMRLAATSKDPGFSSSRFFLLDNRYVVFEGRYSTRHSSGSAVFGFGLDGLRRCPAGPFLNGLTNLLVRPDGVAIMSDIYAAEIISWQAGSAPSTLVHSGDPAPGMPGTGIVLAVATPGGICAAGPYVMFWAGLRGPGVERLGWNPSGVWLRGPSGLSLVTALGIRPADGVPPPARAVRPLDVDATGRTAVLVDAGVWIGQPGNLKLVPDATWAAPVWLLSEGRAMYANHENRLMVGNGTDKGTILVPEADISDVKRLSVSPSGNLAWVNGDSRGVRSLFVCVGGRVRTLLWEGQPVEVGPGDVRVISKGGIRLARDFDSGSSTAVGPEGWRTFSSINDRGEVAVTLQFDAELGVRDRSEGVVLLRVP